ncbi:uncharacterized protein K441DRAFT_554590, partial [Cenococcum geophilum 1.58]|uniref:uncharacterized protein n=1 Tax=Cenococcum geophilum 1.58 TaxID=794803 RepID=UPI00358E7EB4
PYLNIVRYYSYIINYGHITGLALKKYGVILQYCHKDVPYNLNITAYINSIRASIRHLHFLRLAYNNLNPTNIALNSDDNPIILNFGSYKKFSKELLLGGIYG